MGHLAAPAGGRLQKVRYGAGVQVTALAPELLHRHRGVAGLGRPGVRCQQLWSQMRTGEVLGPTGPIQLGG